MAQAVAPIHTEAASRQSGSTSVTMTIYSPVSENLNFFEPVTGDEAEGNCVAVRRGGKQPKAKDRSQTDVNSIRCANVTSLLVSGEACAMMRDLNLWHPPVIIELRTFGHGWSGNVPKEVYVSGESCLGKWLALCQPQTAVRASIVAMKSGNADEAKGGRKDEISESVLNQTIWNRLVLMDLEPQRSKRPFDARGLDLCVPPPREVGFVM